MEVYQSSRTAAELEYALGAVPSIGENGNWWIGDEDTGVPASGAPTDLQVKEAVSEYLDENPVSGGVWTLLGDVTVDPSAVIDIIPLSITGGVVTIDPASENYDMISRTGKTNIAIVGQTLGANITSCGFFRLSPTDYDAGTFALLNGDNGAVNASYDVTKYKIVLFSVTSVAMSNIPQYKRYKVRYALPYAVNHGARQRFNCNVVAFCWPALSATNSNNRPAILDIETAPYMDGSEYHYVLRTERIDYSMSQWSRIESPVTIPNNGIVTFSPASCPFGPGARIQLWGSNE